MINGIDVIIEMDVISHLGGMMISNGSMVFGISECQAGREEVLCAVAVKDVQVKKMEIEEPKVATPKAVSD